MEKGELMLIIERFSKCIRHVDLTDGESSLRLDVLDVILKLGERGITSAIPTNALLPNTILKLIRQLVDKIDFFGFCLSRVRLFSSKIAEKKSRRLVEVSVSSGSMGTFLSHLDMEVVAMDNSRDVIEKTRRSCEKLNADVDFILARYPETFTLNRGFAIVFSQSVTGHFTDGQIRTFLGESVEGS